MGFQQGLSGLNGAAKNLDVIGNNVSNANTVGFKQSQAQFADAYNAAQGTGTVNVGIGTKVAAVAQQFGQGSVTATSNPLDIAISGKGFFRMQNSAGETLYGRNGQFQMNKDGYIVNSQGHFLTGYPADPVTGAISTGTFGPVRLPTQAITPNPTTKSEVGVNLDARETPPKLAEFNPADPESYNRSTSMNIFDTLGNEHVLSMYFVKQATPLNTWNTYVTVDNKPINTNAQAGAPGAEGAAAGTEGAPAAEGEAGAEGAAPNTPQKPTGTLVGTLTFNSMGALASTNPATTPLGVLSLPGGIVFENGATTPQQMTMDFSGSTQFGTQFGVTTLNQDGYTSGQLNGFSTSPNGVVIGRYTNGQSKALGQVVLANFANEQGLQAMGNNEWSTTANSGQPVVGVPGSATLGVLQSGAVEDSNIDLTAELVNMIVAQRVYQANAQSIKAQDSILQTITNIR